MPPKKDANAHNSSINNNNTTSAETSTTTSTTTTSTSNSPTISVSTNLTQSAAAATSSANNTSPVTVATVVMPDAAAEQRTIAFQANAKLCRLVRKCPWMYDRNHHNYAKKHILDKSWCKIARECNDSGRFLREKVCVCV